MFTILKVFVVALMLVITGCGGSVVPDSIALNVGGEATLTLDETVGTCTIRVDSQGSQYLRIVKANSATITPWSASILFTDGAWLSPEGIEALRLAQGVPLTAEEIAVINEPK